MPNGNQPAAALPPRAARPRRNTAARIAGAYLAFGLVWIGGTELALRRAGGTDAAGFWAATGKGAAFVVLSAALVFWLTRREFRTLTRTADLLRAVAEGTTDAVFVKDRAGKYLLFNAAAARFVGKAVADVLGKDDTALFEPAGARRVMARDRRVMENGCAETEEETLTAAGATRIYQATKAPLRDETGAVVGLVGISREVTEGKRIEAALRETRDRLDEAQRIARLGSWTWEPETDAVWWSETIYELFGYAPGAVAPSFEAFLDRLHPDDRPVAAARVAAVLAGADGFADDLRVVRPDGPTIWIHSRARVTRAAGRIVRVEGTDQDVTAQKHFEAALRASEERYRTLLDRIPDPVFVYDRETLAYLAVNDAAVATYGYSRDEFLRLTIKDVRPAQDVPDLLAMLARAPGGFENRGGWRHRKKDGTVFDVEIAAHDLELGGRPACIIVARDVTDRKRAEDELRRERDRLTKLAETAPGVLHSFRLRPDGTVCFAYAPPSIRDIYGLTPAELAADAGKLLDLFHPADRERVVAAHEGSSRSLAPVLVEYRVRHPERGEIWVQLHSAPVREPDGGTVWHGFLLDVTDRKREEQRLRESEEQFRTTFEQAAVGMTNVSLDGRFVRVNERFAAITGYTRDELMTRTFADITHPDDRAADRENVARLLAGAVPNYSLEKRYFRKDGALVWVNLTVSLRFTEAGEPLHFVGVIEDVTARKRAEDELRRERDRFEKLVEAIPLAICSFRLRPDGSACFPYASPRIEQVYGLGPAELARDAAPVFARMHPADAAGVRDAIAESARALSVWRGEFRVRRPGGEEIWVEGCSAPVREADGSTVWHGYIADVTDRRRADDALRESEEQFRAAFEQAAVGMAHVALDGRYLRVNGRFADSTGYTRDELLAHTIRNLTHPDDRDRDEGLIGRVVAGDIPSFSVEKRYVRKGGEFFWANLTVSLRRTGTGEPLYLIGVTEDITERKRAEDEVGAARRMLRLVIDNVPMGVFWKDRASRYLGCNLVVARALGFDSPDEVVGRTDADLGSVTPEQAAFFVAKDREVMSSGVPRLRISEQMTLADGRTAWLETNKVPFRNAADEAVGVLGTWEDVSERKRTELALRESEELFRATFEQAAVGMAQVSPDGRFLRVNGRFAEITGYTRAELLARTFADITHPDDLATDLDRAALLLAGGVPNYSLEKRYVRNGGGTVWVNLTVSLRRTPAGAPLHFISVVEDVSARKRVEDELRASELRYRTLVDHATDAIVLHDAAGAVVDVNAQACAALGYTRDELIGMSPLAFDPVLTPDALAGMLAALDAGELVAVDTVHRRKDGTTFPVEVRVRPFRVGGARFGLAIFRDISARKRAEHELRASEERFRTMADAAPVLIWLADADKRCVWFNRRWLEFVDRPMEREVGFGWTDHVHPDDRAACLRTYTAAFDAREPFAMDYRLRHRDGEYRWVLDTGAPLLGSDGAFSGYVGSCKDITDRKRAEDAVREQAAFVQGVLDSMTAHVAVLDATGAIVAVNRAWEQFAAHNSPPGGPPARTAIGTNYLDVCAAGGVGVCADGAAAAAAVRRVMTGGADQASLDYACHSPTDQRWFLMNVTPLRRGRGEVVVSHTDVTERRRVEEELRESEIRLRALAEGLADPLYVHDELGTILYCNPSAARSLGYTADEVLRLGVPGIDDTFARQDPLGRWAEHLNRPAERATVETTHRRKDGTTFPIEVRLSVIPWQGQLRFLALVRDLTERRRAAAYLAAQTAVLERIAGRAPLPEVLAGLVAMVEGELPGAVCSILLLDRDGRRLRLGAGPNLPPAYNAAVDGVEIGPRVGSCGTAAFTRAPVRADDIATDPLWIDFRALAAAHGLGACWSVPIFAAPRGAEPPAVLGTFAVYRRRPGPPDARFDELLERAVRVASIALESDRAARELGESEARFRKVFEHAATGIAMTDAAGRFQLCNPAYRALLGYADGELRRTTFAALVHPDDRDANATQIRRLLSGELPYFEIENRYVHKSGHPVWVHKFVSVLPDETGRPAHLVALVTDATERRRAEREIRESEARFRNLIDFLPDAVYINAGGRLVFVNPACARLFGAADATHLLGKTPFDLMHPDDHSVIRRRVAAIRETSGPVPGLEETAVRLDGTCVPVYVTALPISDRGEPAFLVVLHDLTERKRAEADLRDGEERLRLAVETAALGVIQIDLEARTATLSPPAAVMMALPAETPVPLPLLHARFHPDDRAEVERQLVLRLGPGGDGVFGMEHRVLHPGGGVRWLSVRSRVYAEGGIQRRAITVAADVTDRKLGEVALRESEVRFRTLIEFLPDAVYINGGGRVVFCNPACVRLFGAADPAQILGKTPFDLMHPDDHAAIRARIAHQHATGAPVPGLEERIVRLDGRAVPVHVTALPITDRGAGAILVVLHDLTERKRIELELRHQEMMLREAAELAHVGGWGFDPVTLHGDWTAETTRIHDLDPSTESTVAHGLRFFEGADRATLEAALRAAIDRGTPYDLELQLTSARGVKKWVRTICRPITDNGKVVRVRGSLQDITDRKRAEAEIRQLNAELEQRVRDRTAELEAANKELEAFSYSVSHDLRAPLRAVGGFSRIVVEEYGPHLPEKAREYLADVQSGARRMGQLVDDLLAFSRIGRAAINRQTIDAQKLVEDCLREVTTTPDARRIDARVADLPPCRADLSLLRQVWLNLLSNAVKYSGKRNPAVVEVGATAGPDGPTYFVRDNGVGFDMRYAHKLFGVFQRLHRAEEYEGTGIGLALVQRIVQRHGGRVWAEAAPDAGATFYFSLGGARA